MMAKNRLAKSVLQAQIGRNYADLILLELNFGRPCPAIFKTSLTRLKNGFKN